MAFDYKWKKAARMKIKADIAAAEESLDAGFPVHASSFSLTSPITQIALDRHLVPALWMSILRALTLM